MLHGKYYIIFILSYLLPSLSIAQSDVHPEGKTVVARFGVPSGYQRTDSLPASFAFFLQHLPLLPPKTPVKFYDGAPNVSCRPAAVIDMEIGDKNLQQNIQTMIRLWAEYLFEQQRFSDIFFHINNGQVIPYEQWTQGMKLVINRKTYWTKTPSNPKQYQTFRRYLNFIFTNSDFHTLLQDVQLSAGVHITPGDILTFDNGADTYVVMVLDAAVHRETGDMLVLLVSGGNPAQSVQVLQNTDEDSATGVWFPLKNGVLTVGEMAFSVKQRYRFRP
ncbi:MAG: DUF4846 domain-containing protein [Prevotellaceae bacterium]|jgi:hypothetical protein|nr:DUF4846 domain-containing protein [Prevotellaceae bacterium]